MFKVNFNIMQNESVTCFFIAIYIKLIFLKTNCTFLVILKYPVRGAMNIILRMTIVAYVEKARNTSLFIRSAILLNFLQKDNI